MWSPELIEKRPFGLAIKIPTSSDVTYLANRLKHFEEKELESCRQAAKKLKEQLDAPSAHHQDEEGWKSLWTLFHGFRKRTIRREHPDGRIEHLEAAAHLQPHLLLPGHPLYVQREQPHQPVQHHG
jgi:hypothetical protein